VDFRFFHLVFGAAVFARKNAFLLPMWGSQYLHIVCIDWIILCIVCVFCFLLFFSSLLVFFFFLSDCLFFNFFYKAHLFFFFFFFFSLANLSRHCVGLAADGQPGAGGSQWVRVKIFHFSIISLFFRGFPDLFQCFSGFIAAISTRDGRALKKKKATF
jgi:hypothetical protein